MKKIAFVILHYNIPEVTRHCVASVLSLDCDVERKIIIVDNGSPDGSGRILEEEYAGCSDIAVILTGKNLGFANGNNAGYRYARDCWGADTIVITNNDIIFRQRDFILRLELLTEQFGVVGPDIVTLSGEHQNPFRKIPYEPCDVRRAIRNKRVFLAYFYLKKYLHLDQKIFVLENLFQRRSEKRRAVIDWTESQDGIVLQGACMIFMPCFVHNEREAFCTDTFMYGEEDILNAVCRKKGYRMAYLSELQVLHLDGKSTGDCFEKSVEKEIFIYKNTLKSLQILRKILQDRK